MDENKEKSTGGDLKEEMDELARIFKEELDKAVKDAEDAAEIDDLDKIEVEGYNPKTLSLDKSRKREHSAKDELCESLRRASERNCQKSEQSLL